LSFPLAWFRTIKFFIIFVFLVFPKEIIFDERKKPDNKKKSVYLPLPDHLRRETEVIELEGIDKNWECIGQDIKKRGFSIFILPLIILLNS
jgi:hypothetical protein